MQSQQINKRSILLFAQGEKRKMSKNKRFYLFSRSDLLFSSVFDYRQLCAKRDVRCGTKSRENDSCFTPSYVCDELQFLTMIRAKHQRKPSDFVYLFYHEHTHKFRSIFRTLQAFIVNENREKMEKRVHISIRIRVRNPLEIMFQYVPFACCTWNVGNDWKRWFSICTSSSAKERPKFNTNYSAFSLDKIFAWNRTIFSFASTPRHNNICWSIYFSLDFAKTLKTSESVCEFPFPRLHFISFFCSRLQAYAC